MTADLIPFDFNGAEVRVVDRDGDLRFVAADVLSILDVDRTSLRRLDEDEKGVDSIHTLGGEQQVVVVTESGLYSLILGSRKPEARAFKRWITSEVIPAIRKHGGYLTPGAVEAALTDPDFIIRLATDLKTERAHRALAERRAAELTPAAAAWDHMASSAGDWSVQQAAGILARDPSITLGRQRLFIFMESSHWIFRKDGHWMAYADKIDALLLSHRAQHHVHPRTGEVILDPPQVRVTAKGLARLHKMLGGSEPIVALAEVS